MKAEWLPFSLKGCSSEPKPTVQVLVVYEDQATGMRAREVYDNLVRDFGEVCDFEQSVWKGDVLTVRKLRQQAAAEACEADMVILSVHGDGVVPAWLDWWSEAWLSEHRKEDVALVALFDPESEAAFSRGDVHAFLEYVSLRGQMDFIPQVMSPPRELGLDSEASGAFLPGIQGYQEHRLGDRDDWRRWGLND